MGLLGIPCFRVVGQDSNILYVIYIYIYVIYIYIRICIYLYAYISDIFLFIYTNGKQACPFSKKAVRSWILFVAKVLRDEQKIHI